jgi:hypothetical protein
MVLFTEFGNTDSIYFVQEGASVQCGRRRVMIDTSHNTEHSSLMFWGIYHVPAVTAESVSYISGTKGAPKRWDVLGFAEL